MIVLSDSESPGLADTRALFSSPNPESGTEDVRQEIAKRKGSKVRRLKAKVSRSKRESAASVQEEVARQRSAANQRLHRRLEQLERSARSTSGGTKGALNATPAKVTLYCSEDGLLVGQSRLEVILREASDLGSYLPVVFGDVCIICLYDSGASLTQFDAATIKRLGPKNLTLVDSGLVDFISVESKRKMNMSLYLCNNTSLLHVESGKRSPSGPVYVVGNPIDKTFPGLLIWPAFHGSPSLNDRS